ncbi:MAG: helix-turn-helix transcriptional regulator [Hungatella hathewayi]|nr:helix-turn-helix transcriptional regulator [Hungatella hathewayi]MBS5064874.1 helix-turn-helix transcriptional regulator [Hungatella hathewayi]
MPMEQESQKRNQFSVEVGARIAARRKQLNLTQEQAAEKADVSHQFFACVERGIKNMRAENIVKVSRALEVSTDYILLGTPNERDSERLSTLCDSFSPKQMQCMEQIIQSFRIACDIDSDEK